MTASAPGTIRVLDLLVEVGFAETNHVLRWKHEGIEISARKGFDVFKGGDMVQLGGIVNTGRTLSPIEYAIPAEMECRDEALALIAYGLRDCQFVLEPWWITEGNKLKDKLPWERDRIKYEQDRAIWKARPTCTVGRQWFRPIKRRLLELACDAEANDNTTWTFDGRILSIDLGDEVLVAPASGEAWEASHSTPLGLLVSLPKRLQCDPVVVSTYKSCLWIDDVRVSPLAGEEP